MPTPVSSARQCLTGDAARALDEAVAVARRRGHAQTTSLHAVSALLSLPSSSALRDACSRARSSSYSPRHQLRALELCFGLALDRLSSSSSASASDTNHEPPISNSLMAAIKRSQATQRRNPPDAFLLHHHHHHHNHHHHGLSSPSTTTTTSSSSSSASASSLPSPSSTSAAATTSSILSVKVELQPLILSILDDPVVSRVFADAGFRSCDVKMALLRPPSSSLLRFPRSRCPPLFLCNLTAAGDPHLPAFNFPFSGLSAFSSAPSDFDDNYRRIADVLGRKTSRNPLLVGVSASDALRGFADCLDRVVPRELSGLKLVWLDKWIGDGTPAPRLVELGQFAGLSPGPGVIVAVGDLTGFLADSAGPVVGELAKILDLHRGRLWLMGSAANYETYMKFLTRFPSVEKDWDLQLLPITSLAPTIGCGLHSKPQSLMESFVPFGGLFTSAIELRGPLSNKCQAVSRCQSCNDKYEQEVTMVMKGCSDSNVVGLPSWLCKTDLVSDKDLNVAKAKDDGPVLNAKVVWLQKKWNDICRQHHHQSQLSPSAFRLPCILERKGTLIDHNRGTSQEISGCGNLLSASTDLLKTPLPDMNSPMPVVPESNTEELTTDLSLGTLHVPPDKEQKKRTFPDLKEHSPGLNRCSSTRVGTVGHSSPVATDLSGSRSTDCTVQNSYLPGRTSPSSNIMSAGVSPSCTQGVGSSSTTGHFGLRDVKSFCGVLIDKVGRQDEALCSISHVIARCKVGNGRRRGTSLKGDVWLNILGPDRIGKKKIAMALAETVFGSVQNFISLDCLQDGVIQSNSIFKLGQKINGYDSQFRGKTVVDHITEEISKRPLSVVFLENVEKADSLLQTSLLQAVKTGKFRDLCGREIGINNAIFVTTAETAKATCSSDDRECVYSEERVLTAQGWQMKILVSEAFEMAGNGSSNLSLSSRNKRETSESTLNGVYVNKRKLDSSGDQSVTCHSLEKVKRPHWSFNTFLDLNLSVEEMGTNDASSGDHEHHCLSESTGAWLEEFFDLVDETVTLKPFDFDSLAANVLKKINETFRSTIGHKGLLEIDSKAMDQILAAIWLSDGKAATVINDWVDQVLKRCFVEAQERYTTHLSHFVLKLITMEECLMEEQAPGVCLPARVIVN